MGKKTQASLERLQRAARTDRPTESERDRVADQLLTQDQLRKINKTLGQMDPIPARGKRKLPPRASLQAQSGQPQVKPATDHRPGWGDRFRETETPQR